VRELPEMMKYRTTQRRKGGSTHRRRSACTSWERSSSGSSPRAGSRRCEINEEKAAVLYDFLDSQDFYIPHAEKDSRSLMNITFKCPTPELDKLFIAEARRPGSTG
jgi:hypothetical protein